MTRKDSTHDTPGKARKLKTRTPGVVDRTGCLFAVSSPVSSSVGLPYSPGDSFTIQKRRPRLVAALRKYGDRRRGSSRVVPEQQQQRWRCSYSEGRGRLLLVPRVPQEEPFDQEYPGLSGMPGKCASALRESRRWWTELGLRYVLLGRSAWTASCRYRYRPPERLKNQQGEASSSLASPPSSSSDLMFLHAYYQTDVSASGRTEVTEGVLQRQV